MQLHNTHCLAHLLSRSFRLTEFTSVAIWMSVAGCLSREMEGGPNSGSRLKQFEKRLLNWYVLFSFELSIHDSWRLMLPQPDRSERKQSVVPIVIRSSSLTSCFELRASLLASRIAKAKCEWPVHPQRSGLVTFGWTSQARKVRLQTHLTARRC